METLFLYPLVVFFAFTPILLDLTAGDQGFLETLRDKYLQDAQIQGGFTPAVWDNLKAELESRNLDYSRVRFDGSTPVGMTVLRGEKVYLNIGYPRGNNLGIFSLIGVATDPDQYVWARGSIISERPRP